MGQKQRIHFTVHHVAEEEYKVFRSIVLLVDIRFFKNVLKSSVIPFKLARGAQLRIDFALVTPQSSGSLHLTVTGLQLSKSLKTTLKKVTGSITSDTGSSDKALNMYHLLTFCLSDRAE